MCFEVRSIPLGIANNRSSLKDIHRRLMESDAPLWCAFSEDITSRKKIWIVSLYRFSRVLAQFINDWSGALSANLFVSSFKITSAFFWMIVLSKTFDTGWLPKDTRQIIRTGFFCSIVTSNKWFAISLKRRSKLPKKWTNLLQYLFWKLWRLCDYNFISACSNYCLFQVC